MVDNIQQLKTARRKQTKKEVERKCTDTCHQTSELKKWEKNNRILIEKGVDNEKEKWVKVNGVAGDWHTKQDTRVRQEKNKNKCTKQWERKETDMYNSW